MLRTLFAISILAVACTGPAATSAPTAAPPTVAPTVAPATVAPATVAPATAEPTSAADLVSVATEGYLVGPSGLSLYTFDTTRRASAAARANASPTGRLYR